MSSYEVKIRDKSWGFKRVDKLQDRETTELINYRVEKMEKDCGMTFGNEFKCGFLTGYIDLLEYLEEQTKGE